MPSCAFPAFLCCTTCRLGFQNVCTVGSGLPCQRIEQLMEFLTSLALESPGFQSVKMHAKNLATEVDFVPFSWCLVMSDVCCWNLFLACLLVEPMQTWPVTLCCIWCTTMHSLQLLLCGQGRSLPGLQLQSLFLKSRDVTSELSLDVESLWNGSGGLENLECATCILAIQALSLFWWH